MSGLDWVRCLAGLVGEHMMVFSCPACGGRAFTLSEDLSEAQSTACAKLLGSWKMLRRDISRTLVTLRQRQSSIQHVSKIANGNE